MTGTYDPHNAQPGDVAARDGHTWIYAPLHRPTLRPWLHVPPDGGREWWTSAEVADRRPDLIVRAGVATGLQPDND